MKAFPGYTDPFLSPVTGLLAREQPQPDLERGYIWIGDKNNRPIPSFKLIDLTIDVRSLQQQVEAISEAPIIVNTPVSILPNAQALSDLNDGIMKNRGGLIQIAIPGTDYLSPALPSGNLFIGNSDNIATPQPIITLSNLPNLGTASITIPNPLDPISPITISGGKIWQGTDSNRPEESTALLSVEADIALLNARFLLGEFIMGSALVQTTWPKSQFLINLQDGILKKTGKTLQYATPGTDYLDLVNEAYADGIIPVVLRDKVITRSKLQIINIDANHDNVSGINTLTCRDLLATVQAGAGGSVRADQQLLSLNTVEGRQLILYDYNPAHRYTQYVSLKGPASVAVNINWVMPDTVSATGQVLTDIGNVPLSTDRQLAFRNMPSVDATYILKQPHNTLPNAQALNQLVGADPKMLKAAADGTIEVAIPDTDYATKETLEQIKAETEEFKNQAATSAQEAAASAEEAAASATEATTAAGEATGAAAEATGAAAAASGSATAAAGSALGAGASAIAAAASALSASSSASDASSSASKAQTSATDAAGSATSAQNSLNTLLNTGITLQGAVTGSGNIGSTITTSLNSNQTPVSTSLNFNWTNAGSFAEYHFDHYLQDASPPPQFVSSVIAGTNRGWQLIFQPGFSSQPSGNFQIDFIHPTGGRQTPFKINTYGSTLRVYMGTVLDMQNNAIINCSLDINAGTTGQLNISRLSGYPTSSNAFLRGDGTWILPYINNLNINGTVSLSSYGLTTSGNVSATTGSLIGNNLAAYNAGSLVVQNPLSLTNVSGNPISVTTNSSTNFFLINNTNSGAIGAGLQVQNNSVAVAEFGFNNSTNEAYVWGIGSAILKFGTGNTKRIDIASNSAKTTFYESGYQCYIRPYSNYLDLRAANVYNSAYSTIFESNNLGETSSLVMNGDFMQFINPLDVLGFIFTDEDNASMTSYVAYINGSGQFITSSRENKHSLRKKEHKDYLERLNRLNVYSYGLKYDLLKSDSPKKKARKKRKMNELQVGVMAEDVLELFDNATNVYKPLDTSLKISPSHTPSLAVNSHVLLCYTILAVQELTQRLITLERKAYQIH